MEADYVAVNTHSWLENMLFVFYKTKYYNTIVGHKKPGPCESDRWQVFKKHIAENPSSSTIQLSWTQINFN